MAEAAPDEVPFELALLARAVEYQRWITDSVTPYLGARILEVGAGIGNLSRWLPLREQLYLSEIEPNLFTTLKKNVTARFGNDPRVTTGALDLSHPILEDLKRRNFDTVVSFNVLEHIKDDSAALARLVELLVSGTAPQLRIISLVPAHQWAYGEMDRAYGHFRRYSRQGFAALARRVAPDWRYTARYFNVVGLPGWVVMGRILRKAQIDTRAVDAFDRLCPYIRGLDDFVHEKLRLPLGQSLLAIISLDRGQA